MRRWRSQKPRRCFGFFFLYTFSFSQRPCCTLPAVERSSGKQDGKLQRGNQLRLEEHQESGLEILMRNREEQLITRHEMENWTLEKELNHRLEEIRPGLHTRRRLLLCKAWKPTISDVEAFQKGEEIRRRLGAVLLIGRTFILKSSVPTVNERSRPTAIPADTYFHPHNPQQCGASVHQANSPPPWWDFFFLGSAEARRLIFLLRRKKNVFGCSTGWNGRKRMKEEMRSLDLATRVTQQIMSRF